MQSTGLKYAPLSKIEKAGGKILLPKLQLDPMVL
jgi:hypothetical protein